MKVLVEIDLGPNVTTLEPEEEWFPLARKDYISIDSAYLTVDPMEDSYFVFKLVKTL